MKFKFLLTVLCVFLFLLSACSNKSMVDESEYLSMPVSTPISGKASVVGYVVSMDGKPLPHTAVWLAEVFCDQDPGDNSRCAFVLDAANSPGVYSDNRGYFAITNVDPKKYVVTVGDPQSVYYNFPDNSGRPKVFDIPSDKVTDLGELKVNLPQP